MHWSLINIHVTLCAIHFSFILTGNSLNRSKIYTIVFSSTLYSGSILNSKELLPKHTLAHYPNVAQTSTLFLRPVQDMPTNGHGCCSCQKMQTRIENGSVSVALTRSQLLPWTCHKVEGWAAAKGSAVCVCVTRIKVADKKKCKRIELYMSASHDLISNTNQQLLNCLNCINHLGIKAYMTIFTGWKVIRQLIDEQFHSQVWPTSSLFHDKFLSPQRR